MSDDFAGPASPGLQAFLTPPESPRMIPTMMKNSAYARIGMGPNLPHAPGWGSGSWARKAGGFRSRAHT